MNLKRFFGNFISALHVSDNNLQKFSLDHIQRITVNNKTGMFTTILSDIVEKYEAFFGKITNEDVNFAVQQSLTMSADNLLQEFKTQISQKEGIVRGNFGKQSAVYQEFFPMGLSEYSTIIKANAELLMNRIVTAATKYEATLGSNFVQTFSQIQSNYKTARSLQLGKIGEVKTDKLDAAENRTQLELQLCSNIHYIGYTYPGNVARCMSFFNQSIIQRNVYADTDGIGRIELTVIDAATKEVIRGAVLHIVDGKIADARTNKKGTARSRSLAIGTYAFTVTKEGYQSYNGKIEVLDEDETLLNVAMVAE
jgi:hypothetical protein